MHLYCLFSLLKAFLIVGSPGRNGITGASGETGLKGQSGATGASGFPGRVGATGLTAFKLTRTYLLVHITH